MTLFKQMAIAVSLLILAILAAVMIQNYQTAKKDMIESLYQMTVNNISSLSSTLAENANKASVMKSILNATPNDKTNTQDKTPAIVKSIIDAAFDSGYYKLIEFKTDTYTYRQVDNEPIEGVPAWFVKLSDIKIEPISTEVTHNWTQIGKLTVLGDITLTYKALYKIFINLLYLFAIVSLISLTLLAVMLHFILKPLKRVKHQAEAILNNEFIIEDKEPYTTEFKDVSNAMNSMVRRVKEIFKQATEAIKRNKELQYNDPVTKLVNRRYLMIKLPELIALEGKTDGGTIMLLALEGAEHINQTLGRQKADELFYKLGQIFKKATLLDDDSITARVNGTEFIIVLPNTKKDDAQKIAQKIIEDFTQLLNDSGISQTQSILNIGIYRYKANISVADLLTRVDTALLHAKNDEKSSLYLYEESDEEGSLTKTEWRNLFENSIENASFKFNFTPVKDIQTKQLIHNVVSFEIYADNGKTYNYNALIAPAITLGMTSELYLAVLKLFFDTYNTKLQHQNYTMKLPKEFLEDENNFDKLALLFKKQKKNNHKHLCFEVTDSFASHKTATLLGYVDLFKKYGFSLGIHSYTASASDFSYLKDINPKFIKVDTQFLLDQSQDAINNLKVITSSLDIEIIATGVKTQEDIQMLRKYNIFKLQGSIVDTI